MNFVYGASISADQAKAFLPELKHEIHQTLSGPLLDVGLVLAACDALLGRIQASLGDIYGFSEERFEAELDTMRIILSPSYLRTRLEHELSINDSLGERHLFPQSEAALHKMPERVADSYYGKRYAHYLAPLGVLLHLQSDIMAETPFYSVIDGLLTGNINIINIHDAEENPTVLLLQELVTIAPDLKRYVYAFDFSPDDIEAMDTLNEVADAVVSGQGRKIGFAYITPRGMSRTKLETLAWGICESEQLRRGSCQGIYLDTESMDDIYAFCEAFIHILADVSSRREQSLPPEVAARITGERRGARLLTLFDKDRLFERGNCSLLAKGGDKLESSLMYRNCWVKGLPKERLISALRPHKTNLHTAALLCSEQEYDEFAQTLVKAGVSRIRDGGAEGALYCGEPRDGDFPLRRYVRIVSVGAGAGRCTQRPYDWN